MIVQTTERNEAKRRDSKGFFSKWAEFCGWCLGNPGERSGREFSGYEDRQALRLMAIIGHISRWLPGLGKVNPHRKCAEGQPCSEVSTAEEGQFEMWGTSKLGAYLMGLVSTWGLGAEDVVGKPLRLRQWWAILWLGGVCCVMAQTNPDPRIGSNKYQSRLWAEKCIIPRECLAITWTQSHLKVDTGSHPLQQSSQSDIDAVQPICHGIDLLFTDHYRFTWPCRPVDESLNNCSPLILQNDSCYASARWRNSYLQNIKLCVASNVTFGIRLRCTKSTIYWKIIQDFSTTVQILP